MSKIKMLIRTFGFFLKQAVVLSFLWHLETWNSSSPVHPGLTYSFIKKNQWMWTSVVAKWLRICLPMQGTRVRALVWEDPTCRGATTPVSHNPWACASGACAPQQERPRWWEARAPRWRVAPTCRNWRKPSHRNEDPTKPKKVKINLKKKEKSPYKI